MVTLKPFNLWKSKKVQQNALCMRHHCNCQCDTITKVKVKSQTQSCNYRFMSQLNSTDLTFISFPALDMTHLHNWQHLYLPFNPRWRPIQPIMITSQYHSPPLACHLANHLRPETRPQTDKTKTTAKTLDRWSANILLAFLSNWQFEETRATCHCSQDVQKNLPLVGSRRSETFRTLAKRDLGADGNLGRWPGSLVIRGGAENWWGIETHPWAENIHHERAYFVDAQNLWTWCGSLHIFWEKNYWLNGKCCSWCKSWVLL